MQFRLAFGTPDSANTFCTSMFGQLVTAPPNSPLAPLKNFVLVMLPLSDLPMRSCSCAGDTVTVPELWLAMALLGTKPNLQALPPAPSEPGVSWQPTRVLRTSAVLAQTF